MLGLLKLIHVSKIDSTHNGMEQIFEFPVDFNVTSNPDIRLIFQIMNRQE